MRRLAGRGVLLGLALMALLAACGGQPAPQQTQADFDQSVQSVGEDVQGVAAELSDDLAIMAISKKPSGSADPFSLALGELASVSRQDLSSPQSVSAFLSDVVSQVVSNDLTRGTWHYDTTSDDWVYDGDSDDFVLTWPFDDDAGGSHSATLTIDWENGGVATVYATDEDGDAVEVPQDALLTMTIDGAQVASIRGQFSWYTGSCGTILEPASANISGYIGSSDRLEIDLNLAINSNGMNTSGSITARASNGDSGTFAWNLSANGNIDRGVDCFISDFVVNDGSANLSLSVSEGGESHSVEFNTGFAINYDGTSAVDSIGLSNGYVKIDGQVAATFSGTLDDANSNGIPGENVTVNFSDGSATLEQILQGLTSGS